MVLLNENVGIWLIPVFPFLLMLLCRLLSGKMNFLEQFTLLTGYQLMSLEVKFPLTDYTIVIPIIHSFVSLGAYVSGVLYHKLQFWSNPCTFSGYNTFQDIIPLTRVINILILLGKYLFPDMCALMNRVSLLNLSLRVLCTVLHMKLLNFCYILFHFLYLLIPV